MISAFRTSDFQFSGSAISSHKNIQAAATAAETAEDSEGKDSRAKDAETEDQNASDAPVLGGESIEGYEGYEYLYEEILITETKENKETGKKERKKLTVYIPDDESTTANGNYAYADTLGVKFRVELEPYIRYEAEDYLPEENLDEYVANKYDPFYTTDYKDVVITPAKEAGDGVVSTVEYCEYDEWDDIYYSEFCTYYLVELESGETVLVTTEITSKDITGRTEGFLEELEQFYQFDIDWDEERANQKSADYAENGVENTYATSSLLFELPEGWEKDDTLSSYDMPVYAPEGDATYSGCMIAIAEEYLDYGEEVDLNALTDSNGQELIKEMFGDTLTNYSTELCDTGLGEAAKCSFTVTDGSEEINIVLYMVLDDYKLYRLMAYDASNAVDNAAIVLDGIMATGQFRN